LRGSGHRIDRRTFLARGMGGVAALAVGGAGASLLSGCGTSSSSTNVTSNPNAGIGSGSPRTGGSVIIGVSSEIDGFLPTTDHWDWTGLTYATTVYDSLTRFGADGTVHPYLAQSVTPNSDMTEWTVVLRPGITFHDGSPLNSQVLIANFNALKASPLTGKAAAVVSSARATDDMTTVYTTAEPFVAFPHYLTQYVQIGSPIALSQLDKADSTRPIGTGPFVYSSWVPNDHFTVVRNPHYWRSGLPYLDSITFKPIVEDDSREEALRSGTIDVMVSADPNAIKDLSSNSSFQQVNDLNQTAGQPDMDFICLNTTAAPLNDVTVRQALAYATNAPELVRLFGAGVQKVNLSLFPEGSPYRPADNGYPNFDLSKAKQLVGQAAPRHGGKLEVTLGSIPDPRTEDIVQAVQSMWQSAGFQVSSTTLQQVTYIDNLATGSFQAFTDEQFSATDPDLNYVWLSDTTSSGSIALNFARNSDPRIEAALQKGRTSADPEVRVEAYQTVDKLLAQDVPYIWVNRGSWSLSGADNVENFAGATLVGGGRAEGFRAGTFIPTEIWLKSG
jgi:peptide/nickel transport system substrate-binding protein